MAKKYYAVRIGKTPGIYTSWSECKAQVDGFPCAAFKSFQTREAAQSFIEQGAAGEVAKQGSVKGTRTKTDIKRVENTKSAMNAESTKSAAYAYVDGSYSKEQKRYAYGCVIIYRNKKTELKGADGNIEYASMRNVAGEIMGSMKAIEWAIANDVERIDIYHDYEGIAKWANGDWKANKQGTIEYREFVRKSREKISIRFIKVAAHTGVELNERADALAKSALE